MKTNVKPESIYTHEGAKAQRISELQQLERSVMACLLWEKTFYESGEDIASRVKKLIKSLVPSKTKEVINLVLKAKNDMHLRHMPLYMTVCLFEAGVKGRIMGDLVFSVIQRADEMAELIALYWQGGKKPLPTQMKVGIARAFHKFNEYQFAKYNRDAAIKLRDALFLTHPKPKDEIETLLFKSIAENTLKTPDTWEVALSGGKDKKETFERLMKENKLGGLAFLRNLRNMLQSDCSKSLIKDYFQKANFSKVLPFRFIAAANHAVSIEDTIQVAMVKAASELPKLKGKTILLVDNSLSMRDQLSGKSDLRRTDAAAGLAILLREVCEDVEIYAYSYSVTQIPPRQGFALRDAIQKTECSGTDTGKAVRHINTLDYDRVIHITDEQSHTSVPAPKSSKAYCINVGSYKNGIGYGSWTHIDGFSESVLNYIMEAEKPAASCEA